MPVERVIYRVKRPSNDECNECDTNAVRPHQRDQEADADADLEGAEVMEQMLVVRRKVDQGAEGAWQQQRPQSEDQHEAADNRRRDRDTHPLPAFRGVTPRAHVLASLSTIEPVSALAPAASAGGGVLLQVPSTEPMITKGKPIARPMVSGSSKTIAPRRMATAGLT